MSVRRFALALTAAASFAALTTAGAAVMVVGTGPERACYEAAKHDRATGPTIKTCTDALEGGMLTPRDRAATFTNRSALLITREKAALALKDADSALAIEPSMTAASVNRSAALIMLGRYQEARATIDAAIPLASGAELQRALYNRAMASEQMGDIKAAYYDLKRAVDLDPQFEAAKVELARYQVHGR